METKHQTNHQHFISHFQFYSSKFINNLLRELPFSTTPIENINYIKYFRVNCQDDDESIFDIINDLKFDKPTSFQIVFDNDFNKTLIFENDNICGIIDNVTEEIINIIYSKLKYLPSNNSECQNESNILYLQSSSFNINTPMPINEIINVETFNDLKLNCLYSTENNNTFNQFIDSFGFNDIITIHFCEGYVSFCSTSQLLLLPLFKAQSKKKWSRFKNDQIEYVCEHIKNCKLFTLTYEDFIESLKFFPIYLFQSFALQSEIITLQKYVEKYIDELFTRNFTFDKQQMMTFSTYFYLTSKTVTGYYLLTHPKYESTNPAFILAKSMLEHYIQSSNYVDSQAILKLALMYLKGQGTSINYEKTIKLLTKSANCGNSEALFNLALLYSNGEAGLEKDQYKAAQLYKKAAKEGNTRAQFNLGVLFMDGNGIQKDDKKAIELFERAASKNDSNSLLMLGLIHYEKNDIEKAVELYKKSAQNLNPKAHFNLALLMQKSDTKTAINHYLFAASNGILMEMFNLAIILAASEIEDDKEKAVKLLTVASQNGDSDSQLNLGLMYANGDCGLEVNFQKMVELYKKSANNGNCKALFNLGLMYSNGEKVTKNIKQAVLYYTKASELGMDKATFNLALIYLYGDEGVKQDKKKAAYLFEKVAHNNSKALLNLAVMYQNGDGVEKDIKKASDLFFELAELLKESDEKTSLEYSKRAINIENSNTKNLIENNIFTSHVIANNETSSLEYPKQAINLGNPNTKNLIENNIFTSHVISNDENLPDNQDIEKSSNKIKLLYKKAKKGNANAQYLLGVCYAVGEGVPKDRKTSLKFCMMAAEQGDKMAQFAAASCFSSGKGTNVDKEKAFELYLKSAQQGLDKAQFAVGHFYEYGKGGVQKNCEEARKWYIRSAKQGNKNAISALEGGTKQAFD